MIKKICLALTFTVSLTSCVGMETSYKQYDALGGGYGEEQLSADSFIVYFNANDFTEPELTKKYFLRRSAQLALKNDFDCFVVIEEKRTLIENFVTTNKLAQKTQYYAARTENFKGSKTNELHSHSLSGIVQFFKEGSAPKECQSASTVLKTTNVE